jgi:hypothetical protein
VGELLKEYLGSEEGRKLREKLEETAVRETLGGLLGSRMEYVRRMEVRGRKVWLGVTSSALRSELAMERGRLVSKVNETVGSEVIEEIIVR